MSEYPDTHHDPYSKTVFGFWVYLLTDFMMFGALFATYVVLRRPPVPDGLFAMPTVFAQTFLLLGAATASGLGGVAAHRREARSALGWFSAVFVLGAVFFSLELQELMRIDWSQSGMLSAYITLLSTHAAHVALGLLWIPVLLVPVWLEGVTSTSLRRLTCLKMFWQFVNVVWLFILGIVYLMEVV